MLYRSQFRRCVGLVVMLAAWPALGVRAAEQAFAPAMPLVDAETFLLGRLDVEQVSIPEIHTRMAAILQKVTGDASVAQALAPLAQQATQLRDAFVQAGGREVLAVLSTADIPAGPPLFVLTCGDAARRDGLQAFVAQLVSAAPEKLEVRKHGDLLLLVGTPRTLDRVAALKAVPRAEVSAAAAASSAAPLQLLIVPSANQRRALLETMPNFPPPWDQVTGQVVSDGVQWGVASFEASPTLKVQLRIESKDAAAAEQLKSVVAASLDALSQLPPVRAAVPHADQLLKLLVPGVQGKQLTVAFSEDAETLQVVGTPLFSAIQAARSRARQMQSMNNLKQIALAMHLYYDKYKQFPAAASYDASGKPLLSWRVHLLPFLEQQALYTQFKLDEPWDSPHNRKLADTVVPTYVDPSASLKPGMTTYVLPIGPGTIFGGKTPLKIQEVADGTSNTLLMVTVVPERAVLWTKPDDLEVKEAAPLDGLVSAARKTFVAAFCDGSVHVLSDAMDPKTMWLLLQADDRTPIDMEAVR
ncbi:MAG: DUF1559 domain-containing protein [Pirellulaceae bacterium]|nr:DUF1559 domain-containing protein [Pirellulaceae bacterium]